MKRAEKLEEKNAEADLLFGIVKERYGSHVKPAELKKIRRQVEEIVDTAETLRKTKLDITDEPMITFKPYARKQRK